MPVAEDAPTRPMSPYGSSKLMTEIMLRDVAAAHGLSYVVLRYFNVAGADPQLRTGQSTAGRDASDQGRGRGRARPARARSTCSAPTIRRRTAPASAITSMSAISRARIARRSRYLRAGGDSATLNCGYGHGYSVLEVIEAVRRVSGREFRGRIRRRAAPGDIMAMIAATPTASARRCDWTPQFDDLDTIVAHALAWEQKLPAAERAAERREAVPA